MDTDAKKRDRFRRGLNTKLKEHLNLVRVDSYNELVNMAITQEDCIMALIRTRIGSILSRSGKGGLISPLLQNFLMEHQ